MQQVQHCTFGPIHLPSVLLYSSSRSFSQCAPPSMNIQREVARDRHLMSPFHFFSQYITELSYVEVVFLPGRIEIR